MGDWITAFQTTWGTDEMWGELAKAAALIGTMVVVAFGIRIIRKLVKGASKGKASM